MRQAALRQHAGTVVAVSSLVEILLTAACIAVSGVLISTSTWAVTGLSAAGAAFLTAYAIRTLRSAIRLGAPAPVDLPMAPSRVLVASGALAVSLLNPNKYLNKLFLVGCLGAQHPAAHRPVFACGAIAAAVIWFLVLAAAAGLCSPWLRRPGVWRLLDGLAASWMLAIAAALLWDGLG